MERDKRSITEAGWLFSMDKDVNPLSSQSAGPTTHPSRNQISGGMCWRLWGEEQQLVQFGGQVC